MSDTAKDLAILLLGVSIVVGSLLAAWAIIGAPA